jgi:hypothetical protein
LERETLRIECRSDVHSRWAYIQTDVLELEEIARGVGYLNANNVAGELCQVGDVE